MSGSPSPVRQPPLLEALLQRFFPGQPPAVLAVERLGAGKQASVYRIGRRDGRPLRDGETELILKLYRQDEESHDALRAEYDALQGLQQSADGCLLDGWRVRTPRPLELSEDPPALLMTCVPGKPVTAWLAHEVPVPQLQSLAQGIVAALDHDWRTRGQLYGDLNFQNLLYDPSAHGLSLIDPGLPWSGFEAASAPRRFYPASHDLAYLLFEAAASVKAALGRPGLRRRQCALAERILAEYLDGSIAAADREAWLEEVHGVANEHLNRFVIAPTARGMWRLVVQRAAARRIAEILGRLRSRGASIARPA